VLETSALPTELNPYERSAETDLIYIVRDYSTMSVI
ncbi:hypothetical protein EVA_18087, partial [gut metagenome]